MTCCQHPTIVDINVQSAEYSHQMFARSRQSHQDEVRQLELSGAGHRHRRKAQKNGGSKITRCSSNSPQYRIGVINHIIIEPSAASHILNKKGVDRKCTNSHKSRVCGFAMTMRRRKNFQKQASLPVLAVLENIEIYPGLS
jgi:hypothetical protein